MTVVECPKCSSKFKIQKDILSKETVKMRCSVCSHVFTFPSMEKEAIDKDFDLLIGTNDGELEEKPPQESVSLDMNEDIAGVTEITETIDEEKPEDADRKEAKPAEPEIQPESVIREIDTILGSGEEVASAQDEQGQGKGSGKRMSSKVKASLAALAILFLVIGFWVMKDYLPFGSQKGLDDSVLERGPFFSIPQDGVTYEILTNNSEGAVLVVKGVIRKLNPKPLKSVLVEARVYDQNNNLIESRTAFAGIVPESTEFKRQKSSDIDTLLTAEPRTLGVLETSPDIPFAVAFFGKPAREGYSIQVEVKEFHWKDQAL